MRQLSSVDAALWFADSRSRSFDGASVIICDPTSAPDFCFTALRDRLAARLQMLAPLRCRVAGARIGLDKPWFVECSDVDIDHHVRRMAVPTPGGRSELDDLVGRLISYPMTRARPLWELWFIEGVEHGRVALLLKLNHTLVDGVSAMALVEAMLDDNPPAPMVVDAGLSLGSGMPGPGRRALAAFLNVAVQTPYRLLRLTKQTLSQQLAIRSMAYKPPGVAAAPVTRFNAQISTQRRIGHTRVPLDRMKAVSQAFNVKVNDVVLALVSGALRRYLLTHGELPQRPMVTQIGISTRDHDTTWGNQITSASVRLATDIADPVTRLKTIHDDTMGAKQRASALLAHQRVKLTDVIPPGLFRLLVPLYAAIHTRLRFVPVNMVVSNLGGLHYPRDVLGAPIERHTPLGTLSTGMGLNVTCMSRSGWVEIGIVAAAEVAADIDVLAGEIEPTLTELEETTQFKNNGHV